MGRDTTVGQYGMIAATHHLAAEIGAKVLSDGGNAFDAGIAVQLALPVVEPQHTSLTGGGAYVFKKAGAEPEFIDFREEAPNAYAPDTFCKNATQPCTNGAWAYDERCTGGHATGVPGVPALIVRLYKEGLASKPLKELAAGAIKLARDGFPMYCLDKAPKRR